MVGGKVNRKSVEVPVLISIELLTEIKIDFPELRTVVRKSTSENAF